MIPLGRPRHRREDNIKTDLKETVRAWIGFTASGQEETNGRLL